MKTKIFLLFFLLIYLLFLLVYLAFNTYGIIRIMSMWIKGDATGFAVLVYLIAIGTVIFITLTLMMTLNWNYDFNLRII